MQMLLYQVYVNRASCVCSARMWYRTRWKMRLTKLLFVCCFCWITPLCQVIVHSMSLFPFLCMTYEQIHYKLLYLTYKVFATTQSYYLCNLISLQSPHCTHTSSVVTLAHPPTSFSLKFTNCSFWYVSPRDLRIVFCVRIESRIESAVWFDFESNFRIESAVYTTHFTANI